jgi:hypothetical protein
MYMVSLGHLSLFLILSHLSYFPEPNIVIHKYPCVEVLPGLGALPHVGPGWLPLCLPYGPGTG